MGMVIIDKEKFHRYSGDIKNIEMLNNIKRFRFKVIDVFSFKIKVPIKYAEEFQEALDVLEVTMRLTDCKVKCRSNHTMVEMMFYDKNGHAKCCMDLELYGFMVVIIDKPFKQRSRLKRVTVRIPTNYNTFHCQTSEAFHMALKEIQGLI
jgi:hypothetical protein